MAKKKVQKRPAEAGKLRDIERRVTYLEKKLKNLAQALVASEKEHF